MAAMKAALRSRARAPEQLERLLHVSDDEKRPGAGKLRRMRFVDDRRRRAFLKRHPHEVVTIARLALDGDKQIAGLKGAGIDGNAGGFARKAAARARPQRADQRQSRP